MIVKKRVCHPSKWERRDDMDVHMYVCMVINVLIIKLEKQVKTYTLFNINILIKNLY